MKHMGFPVGYAYALLGVLAGLGVLIGAMFGGCNLF
jgi:hypothetical protein